MEQSTDRRVRKTKNSIRKAFKELIMEKHFSEITVKEIAERADISRRTFYMHYTSIDDILSEMNTELLTTVRELFHSRDFSNISIQGIKELFSELNEILNRNYSFYKRLASLHSYSFFVQMMNEVLRDIIHDTLKHSFSLDETTNTAYTEYICGGIVSLYMNWLITDSDLTLEQLVDTAADITYGGLTSLLLKRSSGNTHYSSTSPARLS